MAIRKVPGARRASEKELRELLKLPSIRDGELSTPSIEARVLQDGRVLLVIGESGVLYPSRESLAELQRGLREEIARSPIINPVAEYLPPVDEFLRDIDAHASRLSDVLRVPPEALDRTPASLEAVDKRLWRMASAKRMTPEVITPLVAYVGEAMRLASDGRWMTMPGRNEPMITARNGRLYQPVAIVMVELVERRRGSLHGAVLGTLGPIPNLARQIL